MHSATNDSDDTSEVSASLVRLLSTVLRVQDQSWKLSVQLKLPLSPSRYLSERNDASTSVRIEGVSKPQPPVVIARWRYANYTACGFKRPRTRGEKFVFCCETGALLRSTSTPPQCIASHRVPT